MGGCGGVMGLRRGDVGGVMGLWGCTVGPRGNRAVGCGAVGGCGAAPWGCGIMALRGCGAGGRLWGCAMGLGVGGLHHRALGLWGFTMRLWG